MQPSRRTPGRAGALAALAAVAVAAVAGRPAAAAADPRASLPAAGKDHARQLGLAVQLGVGYRALAPYDGEYCGDTDAEGNAAVCVGRAPSALGLVAAWGLRPRLELLLELRVGLERDFGVSSGATGPRPFHWSPGAKFYFSDSGTAKLFSTVQLAFDHTGYDGKGLDVLLRNVNGLQFDLHPSYGIYLFAAEQLGARRWLTFAAEAGLGIQGRYP